MLISELNFRDVYHKIFVICDVDLLQLSDVFACDENTNGVMVYGYVDHEAGLTFEVLSCVRISDDNSVYIYGGNEEVTFKFRNGSVKDKNSIFLSDTKSYEKRFVGKINTINIGYSCSQQIDDTRMLKILDDSRNQDYPDDVLVVLFKEDLQPEGCWVRCSGVGDNCILGILLNEPNQDFSVHLNSQIEFKVMKNDDNSFMCISVFE